MKTKKTKGDPEKSRAKNDSTAVQTPPVGEKEEAGFPIVGIGASAGGLSAFEAFFSGMPAGADPGMAFILVQHLAPDHKSLLTELIQRYTRMQVFEVEDGMPVKPNCAYIIPPNRDMAFLNGTLQLLEPSAPRGQRLPIDYFFRSLAQDLHERAICIVLSGTGSDGTLGVRAVKGEGGMVIAQNPESTEYDGMPRSAIATGLVDFVLPPAEMPTQLIAFVSHTFGKRLHPISNSLPNAQETLKKIFVLLRSRTGHDFSHYKRNTIDRRVERRMAVHQIERPDDYVRYLQQNPVEVDSLFRDLLIGVTNFFRDPDAFAILQEQVIPSLFEGKPPDATIRVWTPGCSTGEEAYSIAILIHEKMETLKPRYKVQMFATDIDGRAIDTARSGVYPASIAADISPERLVRYFVQEAESGAYRIHKSIRDMIVFSEQDVIKDPPFSKVDLISCRNLLIYMNGQLQEKLLPLFHYSLNPGGYLFLGTSETVGEFLDLFSVLDRKSKLYQCKENLHAARRQLFGRFVPPPLEKSALPRVSGKTGGESAFSLREMTERNLLQHYAPVAAMVNESGDILYLYGRSGLYLEPSPGASGVNNILKMAREGLRQELTVALHKASANKKTVRHPDLRVKTNGDFTTAHLTVRPVAADFVAEGSSALFLVILEEAPEKDSEKSVKAVFVDAGEGVAGKPTPDIDGHIAELNRKLQAKEEYLQSTNEELETSNEELKSANEEMQSVNEELQSTNEELETSKEELQSVNEELATVNNELQQKVADLSRTNNDMNNLLAGTGIGTIFVDHQLRILRFTPAVSRVINLILTDVGRPVGHIVSNLEGYDRLTEDVQAVLNTLEPKEIDVQTRLGAWYSLRIRPYRTLDNVIEGAVITFVDISEIKRVREALQESEKKFRELYESTIKNV